MIGETPGFRVVHARYAPDLTRPPHQHVAANVVCVLDGAFTESGSRWSHDCGSASVLIRPANELHSNRYSRGGARCVVIEIAAEHLAGLGSAARLFDFVSHRRDPLLSLRARELASEASRRDSASMLAADAMVMEIVTHASGAIPRPAPARAMERAADFIHAHFSEAIALRRVAAVAGVHPAHFARMFRRTYGCSVGAYVRRLRLDRAAAALIDTDRDIHEIASDAGFYDHSHFVRLLKLHTRSTPSEFRRRRRAQ